MTSEEKQEIINAVLAALRTNSKTISQLTAVSALSDDDSIEIGGGKRVTYAVLKSLIAALYNAAISNGINANNEIYFEGSKLKMSAVPDELNAALNEYFDQCVKQDTDHLVGLLYSRIVLLDSMGSELDGLTYTPVAGDLVWRNGYVFRWDGTDCEDGAVQPRKHVLYINKHTGKRYMWNGSAMVELEGTSSINVVNNLTDGGEGDALSAEMGKRLKGKINEVYGVMQTMYAALADIAFTDGKSPAALPDLDWGLPKHALSLGISGNAVVYINGVQHGDGDVVQVEEYDKVSLVVAPAQGYALSAAPTVTVGGQSVTATPNGDGTYTAAIVMGTSNVVVTVSATTSSAHTITSVVKRITGLTTFNGNTAVQPTMTTAVDATTGTAVSNTGSVADGGSYSGVVTPGVGYGIFIVKVMMGSDDITDTAYNLVTREISIAQVTDDVTVTVTVREAENGLFLNTSYHARTDNGGGSSPFVPANAGLLVNDDEWCAMADFVAIPANANLLRWVFGSNTMQSADVTAPRPVWRRCVMYYDSEGAPINFFTIGTTQHISEGYRDMSVSGSLGVGAYIRASFKTSNLSSSKLQYSTDNGSTWNDLYVPQSVQSNNE